jgi:hypothetical protein
MPWARYGHTLPFPASGENHPILSFRRPRTARHRTVLLWEALEGKTCTFSNWI